MARGGLGRAERGQRPLAQAAGAGAPLIGEGERAAYDGVSMDPTFRIGVDLGGTKIEGVLLAGDPIEPLLRFRRPTPRGQGYEAIVDAVVAMVDSLRARACGAERSIGVGIPGAVSSTHGRVKNANTTELIGRPLQLDLEKRLGQRVRVENDANCFALAEALHGAGRGGRCVFGVILGTGVGGGIVLDGRIWPGAQGIAGEWGHNPLDPSGPPCYCGRRGCVETYLCGPAVEKAYREAGGDALAALEVWALREKDPRARRIVDSYEERLAAALSLVVNILDPDVIVLGGGISRAPALAEGAARHMPSRLFNDEMLTAVRPNLLGDSAGVLGAAWLGCGAANEVNGAG